jgi:hypothetical protein
MPVSAKTATISCWVDDKVNSSRTAIANVMQTNGMLHVVNTVALANRQMSFDVSAGREAHRFDGAVRVLARMAGAVVAASLIRIIRK